MQHSTRNEAIAAVKEVLAALPPGIAQLAEEEDEYEHRLEVRPSSRSHCWFQLTFGNYDTYGLAFGHGLRFEDLQISEYSPTLVVQAIVDGNVKETVWFRHGKAVKAMGRITLPDGRFLQDKATDTLSGLVGLGEPEELTYSSYLVESL
jgi:hypothetical protein